MYWTLHTLCGTGACVPSAGAPWLSLLKPQPPPLYPDADTSTTAEAVTHTHGGPQWWTQAGELEDPFFYSGSQFVVFLFCTIVKNVFCSKCLTCLRCDDVKNGCLVQQAFALAVATEIFSDLLGTQSFRPRSHRTHKQKNMQICVQTL